MGLMDNLRSQATQIAQKTQGQLNQAAQTGKARIDQAQTGKRGDQLLRQLGAAVYSDRTGRGTPDSQNRINQLVSTISAHERDNGLNLNQASVPQPSSPSDKPGTRSGGPDSGTTTSGNTTWISSLGGSDPGTGSAPR